MATTRTLFPAKFLITVLQYTVEAYLELYRTSMMELFAKIAAF